ncbi:MAG: helix-turn-helix transcriptional regulator [Spirochaetaceae bacterium]|jgi:transcriptional regulator with XRE-family HTH domain|nr:helix-turn-helix transcriptional regulator [Spirochaetaceae bacterium]
MKLQQIFIKNLKKFRKMRGLSQMRLAQQCETSGNYIGEIEIARRIPSFEKIEKIAAALYIQPFQLFMDDQDQIGPEKVTIKDYLLDLPYKVKEEIADRFIASSRVCFIESLDAQQYESKE